MTTLTRLLGVAAGVSIVNSQSCDISNFDVVGPHTSSPEQCDSYGCAWYLETNYSDCETFCRQNGMECDVAHVVGEGVSFVGFAGLNTAGTIQNSCTNDGASEARYSRVCTCKSHDRKHSSVTDLCKRDNNNVKDACVAVDELADIRCCSEGDYCDCPSDELTDYSAAVATCESRGLRLCTRAEINRGDCCSNGCGNSGGRRTWILEHCFGSPFRHLEGLYIHVPVLRGRDRVEITVSADGESATWSNEEGESWQLKERHPTTGELVGTNSPIGPYALTIERDAADRATGIRVHGELYGANPLRHLAGLYLRLPIENLFHYVEISRNGTDDVGTWRNDEGRSWDLEARSEGENLVVVALNTGYAGLNLVEPVHAPSGQLLGVMFGNDLYSVSPLSGIEGSYERRPVENGFHRVNVTLINHRSATWSNADGVSWTVELDGTTGDLTAETGPHYGPQPVGVIRDVVGSVTAIEFLQDGVYERL